MNPLPCPVDTAVLLWEWGAYLGADAIEKGVDVRVSSWNRIAPNTFPAVAKATANYANSVLIKMEAVLDGYAEGIALDTLGYVSEGSGQNLLRRAEERALHAAGELVDPGRHHPRLGHHHRPRSRLRRA